MGIYLPNMEMPKNCIECRFRLYEYCDLQRQDVYAVNIMDYVLSLERHPDCPLIEIPTPHGRLIDKDKLRHDLFVNFDGQRIPFYDCDNFPTKISYRDLHSILAEQKTVIEAEGSKE